MDSFLVTVTKTGLVDRVLWSDPDGLAPEARRSVLGLFDENGKNALGDALKRSAAEDFTIEPQLRLAGRPAVLSACVAAMDRRFLLFAAEERFSDPRGREFMGLVRLFMLAFRDHMQKNAIISTALSSAQTDMIRTLTGELRNRKRLLEEANARMNTINEDLNNRLVKDALTGLVSRYQYRDEMEYAIRKHPGKRGVFLFIDIDDFKAVNDRYGHAAGDAYLVEFAGRVRRLGFEDMVAMRISGDEFGLFVCGLDEVNAAVLDGIWLRFRETVLCGPVRAKGHSLPLAVSAGMAVYGQDTTEIYELIEYADFAMYAAKRKGKNSYCVFDKKQLTGVYLKRANYGQEETT